MRILVTGAAGFTGSHIAEAYHAARHKVVAIDNLSTGKRENLSEEIPLHKIDGWPGRKSSVANKMNLLAVGLARVSLAKGTAGFPARDSSRRRVTGRTQKPQYRSRSPAGAIHPRNRS